MEGKQRTRKPRKFCPEHHKNFADSEENARKDERKIRAAAETVRSSTEERKTTRSEIKIWGGCRTKT
jgi:hypothetical protein